MPPPSISIALCTHNGARFLEAQLASIAAQTAPPAELVIGDDASGDGTIDILERFAESAPFPVRIVARRERLGHANNFLAIAKECTGDWIAFADQDDVWFDTKLAEVHAVIAANPGVLLVNQRALLCDEDLRPRSRELFPKERHPGLHLVPHRRLPLFWFGFLMTVQGRLLREFDPDLRPCLPPDGARIGNGRWAFLLASALGSYYTTLTPCARYRRHPQAQTGDYRPVVRPIRGFNARSLAAVRAEGDYATAMVPALDRLAEVASDPADRVRFEAAARLYAQGAQALARRAVCHEAGSLVGRLRAWAAAGRLGAYKGPALYSGGLRAAIKDLAAAFKL